ncbi:unnamed protein product [Malus baccata var. baccata]
MLKCIPCFKQLNNGSLHHQDDDDDDVAETPRTKQAIKALTAQDMALKALGAYKNCKPCSRSRTDNRHQNYADSDANSESEGFHGSYRWTWRSNSTPRLWRKEMDSRLKVLSSGEMTPTSVSGRTESVVLVEEDEPKEWVAQVEPGVIITFVSLPQRGNDLKRIRFRRWMLDVKMMDVS